MNKKLYKERAKIAKALAHKTRLEILDVLAEEEHCVCELEEIIDASQSTVSKHLGILKNAGLVDSEKEGLNVTYSLQTPCVNNFFQCLDQVIREDLKRREQELGLKQEEFNE